MENMRKKDLGFGCMRMPLIDPKDTASFDFNRIQQLFDVFLEKGFKYFDVAYTYHGYHAEEAVRRALTERYPREDFLLATKMPLRDFRDEQDMEDIFQEQLEHCGVKFFDCYLLHNMGYNVYAKCCRHHAFEFVQRKKEEGKIKEIGMSFHDTPELLDEILSRYGAYLDFVQLQVNYLDWEQPNVQSRRCLEIADKYHKPVTVMEPCKGGMLAKIPKEAEELMKSRRPDWTPADWAMRFAASQEGVSRVLSGMNDMAQVEDNARTFTGFEPLDETEYEIIWQAAEIINSRTEISCTGCGYCSHGCPKKIAIPQYFSLYNNIMQMDGNASSQNAYYFNLAAGHGKCSDCIMCGQCEKACPQKLPIRSYLKQVAQKFESGAAFPVRK